MRGRRLNNKVRSDAVKRRKSKKIHKIVLDNSSEEVVTLIAGDENVEAAALASGFSDAKYFARVVKKYFGCTPRDLKNYGK